MWWVGPQEGPGTVGGASRGGACPHGGWWGLVGGDWPSERIDKNRSKVWWAWPLVGGGGPIIDGWSHKGEGHIWWEGRRKETGGRGLKTRGWNRWAGHKEGRGQLWWVEPQMKESSLVGGVEGWGQGWVMGRSLVGVSSRQAAEGWSARGGAS